MSRSTRSDPFVGRYLFHLHTTYTDGSLSVQEYFAFAQEHRLDRLIFLEHIRVAPRYAVDRFVAEVREGAAAFGISTLVGFEAKVLPGGALDISDEHARLAEVIGIAEHGFPADLDLWRSSVAQALERAAAAYPEKHLVWVHPGLWLKRHGLLEAHEAEYRELLGTAESLGIRIEWNRRYGLVPPHLQTTLGGPVIGADAHRLADAEAILAELPSPSE